MGVPLEAVKNKMLMDGNDNKPKIQLNLFSIKLKKIDPTTIKPKLKYKNLNQHIPTLDDIQNKLKNLKKVLK